MHNSISIIKGLSRITFLFLSISLLLISCNDKASKTVKLSQDEISGEASMLASSEVVHYICANNCVGSGSPSAGDCPVCGTPYTHNQLFHSQNTDGASTIQDASAVPVPALNTTPAQNANGEFHYTCPQGHAEGGKGAAGNCSVCSSVLEHNQAFHN
jgi:hypothetical protein